MTISLASIPRLTTQEALALAAREYGIGGEIAVLPSERDQNFFIADPHAGRFVLKIANADETAELLDFQNQAMRHVATTLSGFLVPQILPSRAGGDVASIHHARTDTHHWARLLTWVEGEVLAECAHRGPVLFESIGENMAKLDASLAGYSHPAMHRELQWDLRHAGMAAVHAGLLPRERRARVEGAFAAWRTIEWPRLRHSVIHGDANDHNLIIDAGRMAGLLDFGDMLHSATVCDLAIALVYVMFGERQPMAAGAQVIRAYHRNYPLAEAEQRLLFPLLEARLAMSVCYSAHNRARNPGDPYQVVSEAAAWALLDELQHWSAEDALAELMGGGGV